MEKYDIVIIGAGPVGLMLSCQLQRWGYKIKHIDNRPEPTPTGRADGIQPRSLDLLRNMGLKRKIMAHDPAKVYEVAFWDPAKNGIFRTGTWASCPKFIDARYPFTTLLHQGLIERVFIEDIEQNGGTVQRPWTITGFQNDSKDPDYPVEVSIAKVNGEEKETVRAKYLFSGEGARSFVRNQLGVQIRHKDPISHVWGVMDGVVQTDFPDIKVPPAFHHFHHAETNPDMQMKCTIHSDHGSIMVIPREDNMVRLYIQLASSTDPDWNPRKSATEEEVQDHAKKILAPYYIKWDRVEWYSVYPIGQGLSDSPKAGQGMNTAFLDAANLAWKIHHVESGLAKREILKTYESERRLIADNLLDFDSKYAKLFSERLPSAGEVGAANQHSKDQPVEENNFIKTFKESCEFTSGYGVAYNPNIFNWSAEHPTSSSSSLFLDYAAGTTKLRTGRILTPATVTRVVDANVVHLEQEIPLNGAYRIYVFGGAPQRTRKAMADFNTALRRKGSFLSTYGVPDEKAISYHERYNPHSRFFTFATVFAAKRTEIEILEDLPEILSRYRDLVYADDIWDQRVPDAGAAAHAKMGLSEETGGVVVVRPDGYVSCIVKLVEGSGTVDALNEYFSTFLSKQLGGEKAQL
ncbi:hypothetical protein SLS58_004260 [Diplodia intermedia]|uniref:Phenol 2-monooxygenase n=1 Tax=Diplodia intermedia TaxID=856260 RepID=A0ABR3TUJ5_9PEZI